MIRRNVAVAMAMLFAAGLTAGCGNERNSQAGAPLELAQGDKALLREYGLTARDGHRVRIDNLRNRLWVLGPEQVRVYDTAKRQLLREIALPAWSRASLACPADLAVDPSGSALVSSNVLTSLVRIDAQSFELTQHDIRLLDKEHWDVGFSALVSGRDGALFAATSSSGTFWKIDLGSSSARMVELNRPLLNVCALNMAADNDPVTGAGATAICVGRDGRKRLELSSDSARGRVEDAPCNPGQRHASRAERRLMAMIVVR